MQQMHNCFEKKKQIEIVINWQPTKDKCHFHFLLEVAREWI